MTDLNRRPDEKPRDHLIRVRAAVLAEARDLPKGDTRREDLVGLVRAAETFVVDAITSAADWLISARAPADPYDEPVENREQQAENPWACEDPEAVKAALQEVIDGD